MRIIISVSVPASVFLFKMKDAPPDNLMPLGGSKVEFVNKNRQLNYLRYYAKIFVQLCTL